MMGNFIGIFDKIRSCFLISQFIINLKQEKYGYITKFQYKYYALNYFVQNFKLYYDLGEGR